MTTRILASRALRLAVASLLVVLLTRHLAVAVQPFSAPVAVWFALMALAWFVVPGDRRWFVPATLLLLLAWWVWPTPYLRYVLGDRELIVHRITGAVDVLCRGHSPYRPDPPGCTSTSHGWEPIAPIARPPLLEYLGIARRKPAPAADTTSVNDDRNCTLSMIEIAHFR